MAAGAKCSAVTRLEWMLGSNDDDGDEGDLLRCYQVALQIWCHLMICNRTGGPIIQQFPLSQSVHLHKYNLNLHDGLLCLYQNQQATLRIFAKQTELFIGIDSVLVDS